MQGRLVHQHHRQHSLHRLSGRLLFQRGCHELHGARGWELGWCCAPQAGCTALIRLSRGRTLAVLCSSAPLARTRISRAWTSATRARPAHTPTPPAAQHAPVVCLAPSPNSPTPGPQAARCEGPGASLAPCTECWLRGSHLNQRPRACCASCRSAPLARTRTSRPRTSATRARAARTPTPPAAQPAPLVRPAPFPTGVPRTARCEGLGARVVPKWELACASGWMHGPHQTQPWLRACCPVQLCPVGTYQNFAGVDFCPPCQAGTYAHTTGSTACTACPAGSFSNGGATNCTVRGAGSSGGARVGARVRLRLDARSSSDPAVAARLLSCAALPRWHVPDFRGRGLVPPVPGRHIRQHHRQHSMHRLFAWLLRRILRPRAHKLHGARAEERRWRRAPNDGCVPHTQSRCPRACCASCRSAPLARTRTSRPRTSATRARAARTPTPPAAQPAPLVQPAPFPTGVPRTARCEGLGARVVLYASGWMHGPHQTQPWLRACCPVQLCPVGTYQNFAGVDFCPPCQAGTYAHTTGSTACTACPAGSFSNGGATNCTVRGAGSSGGARVGARVRLRLDARSSSDPAVAARLLSCAALPRWHVPDFRGRGLVPPVPGRHIRQHHRQHSMHRLFAWLLRRILRPRAHKLHGARAEERRWRRAPNDGCVPHTQSRCPRACCASCRSAPLARTRTSRPRTSATRARAARTPTPPAAQPAPLVRPAPFPTGVPRTARCEGWERGWCCTPQAGCAAVIRLSRGRTLAVLCSSAPLARTRLPRAWTSAPRARPAHTPTPPAAQHAPLVQPAPFPTGVPRTARCEGLGDRVVPAWELACASGWMHGPHQTQPWPHACCPVQLCPVGTYQTSAGGDWCPPCQAGTYANTTGSTACTACPPGTTSSSGASVCS